MGSIAFPHLGIQFNHVAKSFSVAGYEIAFYGLVIAVAMMTGLFLVMKVADATGQKGDDFFDLGILTLIIGVVCARVYYVLFSWDYYRDHLAEILNLRQGGLAIYGGIIGGGITIWLFCRHRKMPILKSLDTAVIGVTWGQMIGRWGNFFNREAFGEYTDGLLAMRLTVSDVRSYEITELMKKHLAVEDGVSYIQVHPTFLYESIWNLGVLIILLLVTFRLQKQAKKQDNEKQGGVFLLYLMLYGMGRLWIEGLRVDQLLLPKIGLPVSQLISGILVIFSGGALIYKLLKKEKKHNI